MAGFHLVFCADPAATGIMIYEAASAYKEADLLRNGRCPVTFRTFSLKGLHQTWYDEHNGSSDRGDLHRPFHERIS
jgi:hypothetical protein